MRKSIEFFRNLPIVGWPEELHGYVRLWRGVIDVMVEDLINEPRNDEEEQNRASAKAWLSNKAMWDAQGPGFAQVCDNADLEPRKVKKIIDHLVATAEGNSPLATTTIVSSANGESRGTQN